MPCRAETIKVAWNGAHGYRVMGLNVDSAGCLVVPVGDVAFHLPQADINFGFHAAFDALLALSR